MSSFRLVYDLCFKAHLSLVFRWQVFLSCRGKNVLTEMREIIFGSLVCQFSFSFMIHFRL